MQFDDNTVFIYIALQNKASHIGINCDSFLVGDYEQNNYYY